MTQQALNLLQKALSLSEEERAALANTLLASLDSTVDEGAEKAWEEEISRRVADIDSGKAKMIPWEEVREELSSKLNRAMTLITGALQRWPAAVHGTRRFLLQRFPFSVVYREFPSKIQVVAVAHGHRRPGYWKSRL